jgi:dephospho-CoA kinase
VTDGSPTTDGAGNRPEGRRTLRIGLTGPIGCGKSTVARWLAERGAVVVDADAIARSVTAAGEPALAAVLDRFGETYRRPDGSLDRAALGRLVFSNPAALRDLEAIVHPAVRPRIEAAVAAAIAAGAPAVVVEAIKLVEGGLAELCDEVWLVTCDADSQRRRLIKRGAREDDADQRIVAQGDLAARLAPRATRLIDTSADAEATRHRVMEALTAAFAAATG